MKMSKCLQSIVKRRSRVWRVLALGLLFTCFYTIVLLYMNLESENSKLKLSVSDLSGGNILRNNGEQSFVARVGEKCEPQDKFVFIKCMKCGTETLGTVFRRYGYVRNLSFVLPVEKRLYLGWPYLMETYDYRPSKQGFDILMEHAIYNSTKMHKIMAPTTKYITMIREPFSHFISAFYYFKIQNITNMTASDPITEYLNHIDKYERIYKSREASRTRYCIPDGFSITKNLLSHCLGFPLGFPPGRSDISSDPSAITKYIQQLDKEFSLVMIMDYFDESLILLKHMFCWTFKDILYWTQNRGRHGADYLKAMSTPENLKLHRKHDSIDYQLFNHFNKTFWTKINQHEGDFWGEVYSFRRINIEVGNFCYKIPANSSKVYTVSDNPFTEDFTFSVNECDSLHYYLLEKLKDFYEKHTEEKTAQNSTHSKALC